MEKNCKQLLLKDLSARLLYRVKVLDNSHKDYGVSKVINIGIDGSILVDNETNDIQYYPIIDDVRPYLRSLSSMTEEEIKIYQSLKDVANSYRYEFGDIVDDLLYFDNESSLDYLNLIHVDYRGLIEKNLALEAPEDMYI